MPRKDPVARREYHLNYMRKYLRNPENYKKHRERVWKNTKIHKDALKELLDTFRKDGCALCGEKEHCCLSAHHIDPKTKKFSIGSSKEWITVEMMIEELKKCVCLCENCHRKVHAGIVTLRSSTGRTPLS